MFRVHCTGTKSSAHNNGSLQQAWASRADKSTVDKTKKEKWSFKVLGLEKLFFLEA